MVKKTGGFRRKTRQKLKKTLRQKGKISLSKYFQEFNEGDMVCLHYEPAVQGGMYHPMFHGKMGMISGKRGSNYFVLIQDGDKMKKLIVHPVHLIKAKTQVEAAKIKSDKKR